MLKTFALAAVASALTLVTGTVSASAEPLKVIASFSIIEDLAKNVGGDRVEIITLVGPDGDAHVYEPKPADAAAVSAADVVLVNGIGFEGFLPRLIEASSTKAPVVELSKGVTPLKAAEEHDHEHEHEHKPGEADHDHEHEEAHHHHGEFDPHAWQSVPNVKIYVKNIAEALCAADAAGCDTYKKNAAAYDAKLSALDQEVRDAISAIPEDKRTVITSHDAFGYFQNAYGLTFLAPEGVSTESEASAADVAALIRQTKEDKASAIFVENITNPRLIEQIASETGLRVGGELYSDALSTADGPAATYVDMIRHNVSTIKGAILGS
jgi:zinc/manganese transport system substrate-binding protein